MRWVLSVVAAVAVCLAGSSIADAQATRTWVSGVGDDLNPCSRTAPCKTFAGAISKTAAGGEISVLDPGGFGAVTITKSITLNGDGTLGSILAAATNGININAGVNDQVIIRSLSINGAGTTLGIRGIRIAQAKHVHVENVTIENFSMFGIEGANTVNPLQLSVVNTTLVNTNIGIRQSNVAGNSASIENVRIQKSAFGVDLLGGKATVSNSVVAHQTIIGLVAEGASILNVVNTTVSNNGTGINAFVSGSTVNISNSDVFNNSTGVLVAAGGVCNRFQNNRFFSNTVANINGTCNPQTPQ
jgi:hypothetical protein